MTTQPTQPVTLDAVARLIVAAFPAHVSAAMLAGVPTTIKPAGSAARPTEPAPAAATKPARAVSVSSTAQAGATDPGRAAKLRALADAMQATIDDKLAPRLENTRRRANIAEGVRADGYRMQEVQRALYGLADAWERGDVPECVRYVRTRSTVEDILHGYSSDAHEEANRLSQKGALLELAQPADPAEKARRELRSREQALARQGIPGYFPTPRDLAEYVVQLANIRGTVLEPSAGAGHIADVICERHRYERKHLHVCEINPDLREVLKTKGYKPDMAPDFLTWKPSAETARYDRIVMNPPFEHGQDIDHVRHAYEFLLPGGRLAAIMCDGPFFRSDKKSEEFRAWLRQVDGEVIKNPDGAFEKSDRPTGVATRTVIINKPRGE